jgi:hypothetical protein
MKEGKTKIPENVTQARNAATDETVSTSGSNDDEKIYPCDDCGKMRSKNEGGTTFTVCDDCWDKHFKHTEPQTN